MTKLFTVAQVAEELGMLQTSVTRLIRNHKIQASKKGYNWRISEAQLSAYVMGTYNCPGCEVGPDKGV